MEGDPPLIERAGNFAATPLSHRAEVPMNVMEHFRDGGWGMFPTLVFGVLLLGAAIQYARHPERRFVPLLVALNLLTMASGALGFVSGVIVTAGALAADGVTEPTNISFFGVGESLNDVAFALIFVVLAAVASALGAWKIARAEEPAYR